jgi:hypothetical protein
MSVLFIIHSSVLETLSIHSCGYNFGSRYLDIILEDLAKAAIPTRQLFQAAQVKLTGTSNPVKTVFYHVCLSLAFELLVESHGF